MWEPHCRSQVQMRRTDTREIKTQNHLWKYCGRLRKHSEPTRGCRRSYRSRKAGTNICLPRYDDAWMCNGVATELRTGTC